MPTTLAVKTVADQQAVELQEMLDAFVAAPSAPTPKPLQSAPMLPDLPGTQRDGEVLSGLSHGNPGISSMGLDTSVTAAPFVDREATAPCEETHQPILPDRTQPDRLRPSAAAAAFQARRSSSSAMTRTMEVFFVAPIGLFMA